jgi:hypothetical protein
MLETRGGTVLAAVEENIRDVRERYAMETTKDYQWFTAPGGLVRARCREHGGQMRWALTMSHKYPGRFNKNDDRVWHTGHLLQVYKCTHEGCPVEAVA